MDETDRHAVEEHALNRALQHDLLLHGSVNANEHLVFDWRVDETRFGPLFEERDLAIDWMVEWLASDAGPAELRR